MTGIEPGAITPDAPSAADLAALLGRDLSGAAQAAQAQQVIGIVTAMARAYTRGHGFTPEGDAYEDVRAVILAASSRLLANPRGLLLDETVGPESVSYRSAFTGWTVAETYVLNRYRRRAL